MSSPDHCDTARDGLALIQAAHTGYPEGAMAVLRNCDAQMVAAFLARVACDLLEQFTADADTALVLLREQHDGGGGH